MFAVRIRDCAVLSWTDVKTGKTSSFSTYFLDYTEKIMRWSLLNSIRVIVDRVPLGVFFFFFFFFDRLHLESDIECGLNPFSLLDSCALARSLYQLTRFSCRVAAKWAMSALAAMSMSLNPMLRQLASLLVSNCCLNAVFILLKLVSRCFLASLR